MDCDLILAAAKRAVGVQTVVDGLRSPLKLTRGEIVALYRAELKRRTFELKRNRRKANNSNSSNASAETDQDIDWSGVEYVEFSDGDGSSSSPEWKEYDNDKENRRPALRKPMKIQNDGLLSPDSLGEDIEQLPCGGSIRYFDALESRTCDSASLSPSESISVSSSCWQDEIPPFTPNDEDILGQLLCSPKMKMQQGVNGVESPYLEELSYFEDQDQDQEDHSLGLSDAQEFFWVFNLEESGLYVDFRDQAPQYSDSFVFQGVRWRLCLQQSALEVQTETMELSLMLAQRPVQEEVGALCECSMFTDTGADVRTGDRVHVLLPAGSFQLTPLLEMPFKKYIQCTTVSISCLVMN